MTEQVSLTVQSFLETAGLSAVRQKDELLYLLNYANVDHLELVRFTLEFVRDLWISQAYGYKYNEVLVRIRSECDRLIETLAPQERKQRRRLTKIRQWCIMETLPAELLHLRWPWSEVL